VRRATLGFRTQNPAAANIWEQHIWQAAFKTNTSTSPLEREAKKIILAVVVVSVLGCGAFLYFVWSGAQKTSIERVLKEDRAVSHAIFQEAGLLDVAWDQSGIVGKYVQQMQGIDLGGCPSEFQDAFRKHIMAWKKYENVAKRYGGFRGFIKGFLSRGALIGDATSEGGAAQAEIQQTWEDVLQVARKHGAEIPK
jgi:hypothetical protein